MCGGVLLCMGSWHFQPVLCVFSRNRHAQPQRRHRVVLRKQSVSAHRFQRQESPQGHVEKHQGQWLQRPKATNLGEPELWPLLELSRKGKV